VPFFLNHAQPPSNNGQPIPIEITNILNAYLKNDRHTAFTLIFSNNIKVALFNIAGGVFLGVATFINLFVNGYATATTFAAIHQQGMTWSDILKHTLPHSVELIGIWLSGAIGFSIAKKIVLAMRGRVLPSANYYKQMGIYSMATFLIILIAAYIEAYISVN